MRLALYKYIESNKNKIIEGLEIGNLLPNEFITDHGFDFDKFYKDYLLQMHNEAEKIIIYLSPIIFKVSLELYSLSENKTFNIINFNSLEKSDKVSLFYTCSHYDKIYPKDFILYLENISYNINELDGSDRIIELEAITCTACQKSSKLVSFTHMNNYTICKNCIVTYLIDNINTRYKFYAEQKFNNLECNNILSRLL
jgi:hypothetical protein